MENTLLIPQAIDLKNLCDYEESRLLKWNQMPKKEFEDDAEDFFSSSQTKKTQHRPPPGFSPLNTIQEDILEKPVINPAEFITPNTSCTLNPNFPTFLNSSILQDPFSNFGINSPNMFYQNGMNNVNSVASSTNLETTKIQLEIFRLQMQINSLSMMMGQSPSGVANAACAALLQEQMNSLIKQFQDLQLANAASPQVQNLASSQQNTPSSSSYVNFTETSRESPKPSDLTNLRTSQQSSPNPSVLNLNTSPNISELNSFGVTATVGSGGNSYTAQSEFEKVDENRNFWDAEKKFAEDSKTSVEDKLPTNFSTNVEEFFKKIPKLSEKPETLKTPELKNTNPFKADLTENKFTRSNLKSFYDGVPPEPSIEPDITYNPKTACFRTSNLDNGTSPSFDFFDKGKEDSSSNLGKKKESLQRPCTPPSHNFAPVITSSPEQASQQGPKVFYEAGPVLYNKKETGKKTENINFDSNIWKPVPPADSNRVDKSSARITISSFSITKPKPSVEKAKERINRDILDSKSTERNSSLNTPDDLNNLNDSVTTNFSLPSSWTNSHILFPGKTSSQHDVILGREKEDYLSAESGLSNQRSVPAEIFTTVTEEKISNVEKESNQMSWNNQESTLFSVRNPSTEIFDAGTDGRRLLESKPEEEIQEGVQTSFNKRGEFGKGECNLENLPSAGYTRNTNPFMEDINLANSQMETDRGLNGICRNTESLKIFGPLTAESSRIETREKPLQCQDNSSVCYVYQLSSKNKRIIVINLCDEGWLCTDEFVDAFTEMSATSVMLSVLNMISLTVPFKIVDRASHPSLLADLDATSLNVPRDSHNKIQRSVHLTPLKSALRILMKLKIINREDMNVAISKKIYKDGTVLSDMMKLISSYGTFMRAKCKN